VATLKKGVLLVLRTKTSLRFPGTMTRHRMQSDEQILLEDIRRLQVFYEIYPNLTLQAEDVTGTWFEIALHIEVEEPRPPDHPKSRVAFSVLMGLTNLLIQRVKSYAPYGLEMPPSYYTLLPLASDRHASPRLARTISLVFSGVGPYTVHEQPDILAYLRAELIHWGVPHLHHASAGGCQ